MAKVLVPYPELKYRRLARAFTLARPLRTKMHVLAVLFWIRKIDNLNLNVKFDLICAFNNLFETRHG